MMPQTPDRPPHNSEDTEAEATECLGVRVTGPMSATICDEDGWVRSGTFHWGTDYKCTGSVHPPLDSLIWPGCEIRCANPIHVVTLPLVTTLGSVTIAPAQPVDLPAIFNRLGRDHLQQIISRNMHPKGSPEWHRFDQGRWAFREAALVVNRESGYARDIYGAWLDEWTPEDSQGSVR